MPPKAFADLGVDSGGESSSDEEEGSPKAGHAPTQPAPLSDPAPEDLAALGFDGAARLADTVPEPGPTANWAWGTAASRDAAGAAAKVAAASDRDATLAAAAAVDAVALEAARARAESLSRRDGGDKKGLSFKQREKRKRDAGMQGGHKSTVEEEKRVAREMGAL